MNFNYVIDFFVCFAVRYLFGSWFSRFKCFWQFQIEKMLILNSLNALAPQGKWIDEVFFSNYKQFSIVSLIIFEIGFRVKRHHTQFHLVACMLGIFHFKKFIDTYFVVSITKCFVSGCVITLYKNGEYIFKRKKFASGSFLLSFFCALYG